MYEELVAEGNCGISWNVVDEILKKPGGMWIGLFDPALFELDLKLSSLHKLHRIVTIASVLSWGRFYKVPKGWCLSC